MILSPTHFAAGDVVDIYTDHINDHDFQGQAELISKKSDGRSMIMCDENLFTKLEEKPITENGHIPLTPDEIKRNKKYSLLTHYLLGTVRSGIRHVNEELHSLYKHLLGEANTHLNNPQHLAKILKKYEVKWKITSDERSNFFELCTFDEIIRFIYQTKYASKWTHSIFREESWVVEFKGPQYDVKTRKCILWSDSFRTVRKVKKLICICFNDDAQKSELILHKTNGQNISNFDKRLTRESRKIQKNQELSEDEDSNHIDSMVSNEDSNLTDVQTNLDSVRPPLDDLSPSDEDLRIIEHEIFLYNDDQEID